jgi:lipopolysaccharide/colanic/teichoic acid biosynthesis glycosyltransferase
MAQRAHDVLLADHLGERAGTVAAVERRTCGHGRIQSTQPLGAAQPRRTPSRPRRRFSTLARIGAPPIQRTARTTHSRRLAYWTAKRALDVVGSLALLLLLALPMLFLAALIKLRDPGASVLFKQERTGRGGRRFNLLKFRTMVPNADELKEQLREQSLVPWPDFRLEDDPRVTKLGRFMRRTSLDELPQLINVLRGQMSLVGPRPTSFDASTYDLWQTGRLEFRPGLTGPWQVYGRDSMDFDERSRLEISFFRRPSLLAELRVLALTVLVVFRRTGAA